MDLMEPGSAFDGGLTMPILRALESRSQPASAAQVYRVADQGTAAGIRRALDRLAAHGICIREELGGRALYSLNHDHVLYRAVTAVLDAHDAFVRRLRKSLEEWATEPVAGVLFGSAARRDGAIESDIDLLLIRSQISSSSLERGWARQVHELRTDVFRWTGNHLQVVDWTESAFRRHVTRAEPLIDEILRDGIAVAGISLVGLLERNTKPRPIRKVLR